MRQSAKDTKTGKLVSIGDIERRSGLYILGKPGMGKTTMLVNLIDYNIQHNHGLFFLDPHGDAISDLATNGSLYFDARVSLLDPENETHSFGINVLACRDIESLKQRTDTYTKAYSVFYKLRRGGRGFSLSFKTHCMSSLKIRNIH